jgi:hypothetical protein
VEVVSVSKSAGSSVASRAALGRTAGVLGLQAALLIATVIGPGLVSAARPQDGPALTAAPSPADGNLSFDVAPNGSTTTFVETLYTTATNCSGTVKSGYPQTLTGSGGDTVAVKNRESVRIDAAASNDQAGTFLGWSSPEGSASPFALIPGTGGKSICVAGFRKNESRSYLATYAAANAAPTLAANSTSVTVDEGATASNSGTYSDTDAADAVILTASVGTVTKTGTNGGTWSWSVSTADGPSTRTVTISANDGHGGTSSTLFTLTVNNVAPIVALTGPTTADEGATQTYTFTTADAGNDTFVLGPISCGAGNVQVGTAAFDASTGAGSFDCSFADGPSTATVALVVSDSDGASDGDSVDVTVSNVGPTVNLSAGNPLTVDEGSIVTYGYTITNPGSETIASVTTTCAGVGSNVVGSDTRTNAGGTFKCFYMDGPGEASVSASAIDSDGLASATDSQSVTVNNVAPIVTLTGSTSAAAGTTETYSFTTADPGNDEFVLGTIDCGVGNVQVGTAAFDAGTGEGSFDCAFGDTATVATVSVAVSDTDGAHAIGTLDVTITSGGAGATGALPAGGVARA